MHPSSRRVLLSAAITVPWLMASRGARSQEAFPARPVRLVVPYPPGASTDSMARALARELSRELKVSVVVENRPGGGTTLGALAVRNAPADGYTLLFQVDGLYAGKLSSPSVAYEVGDFDIISPLAQTPFVLVVSAASAIQSMDDLKKRAAAKNGELDIGTLGLGLSHYQILATNLGRHLGFTPKMIPYKGGVEGVTGVMGGEIDAYFATVSLAATLKNNPRARLLALTTGRGQSRFLPGVKTFPELGMPDVVYRSLYGVAIRSGTPPPIRARLEQALLQVAQSPDMKAAREAIALEDYPGTVDEYKQEVQANIRVHQAAKSLEGSARQ